MKVRVVKYGFRQWYSTEHHLYERLAESVRTTLADCIRNAEVPLLSVTSRAKDIESACEKVERKGYRSPRTQMTDLAGVRVIVYVESDVKKVCEIVASTFNVHKDHSYDKTDDLGTDKFGYRSVHYVCDLGAARLALPENGPYEDRLVEIQVRTVLQHAWAEFEHDRGYKFSGELPQKIARDLILQAGALEGVDHAFDRISQELDRYAESTKQKTSVGDLDIEINATSLTSYLNAIRDRFHSTTVAPLAPSQYDDVIREMRNLSVQSMSDLNAYFSDTFIKAQDAAQERTNDVGLIRNALIFADPFRYFKVGKPTWTGTDDGLIRVLRVKFDTKQIERLLRTYDIDLIDED